ncbi:transporter, major facilitator family protein [Fusobacterium equinum]|uniref:Transporter, major facilitator family protein n=1 Tax=Fusobacterium equinum TaxID=134605 RepID=A0A133NLC3_9FUSO|nr:MFS transporter [Fusobacterium equinum]KXA17083.1 transporter, major facilitator family protein [Fusobacterium equinum]
MKNIIALVWGESSLKISSILYSSVITAYLLQIGLTNYKIGILWSIILFVQMICDYPTGGFADKYGRLKIFMIGMIFMGTSIFMMVSGNGFLLYLGAIILGIGESQVSGTLFPWFVHTLNEKGVSEEERKESILKVNAQSQYITNFLGILIGFLIFPFDLKYKTILIIAGCVYILNGLLIYLFFKDNRSDERDLLKIGKRSIAIFCQDQKLWLYSLAMTLHYIFYSIHLFIWQPKANALGILEGKLAFVQSIFLIGMALSGFIVKHINIRIYFIYFLSSLLIPISLITIYDASNLKVYLFSMFILSLSNGLIVPLIFGSMHFFIPDDVRSSVVSLMSSLSSILLVFFQVIIGKILDQHNFWYLSFFCFFIGILYICCIYFIYKWRIRNEK